MRPCMEFTNQLARTFEFLCGAAALAMRRLRALDAQPHAERLGRLGEGKGVEQACCRRVAFTKRGGCKGRPEGCQTGRQGEKGRSVLCS